MELTLSPAPTSAAAEEGIARRNAAILLAALSTVFLVSVFYRPPETPYIPICMFKALTGLPCPGCGLTHSFCALAKGKLSSAFRYNAVGPPIFLLAAGFWLRSAAVLIGKMSLVKAFDSIVREWKLAALFLIALGTYGVGRIAYILAFQPQLVEKGPVLRVIFGLVVKTLTH